MGKPRPLSGLGRELESDNIAARMSGATVAALPALYTVKGLGSVLSLSVQSRRIGGSTGFDWTLAWYQAAQTVKSPVFIVGLPLAGILVTLAKSRRMALLSCTLWFLVYLVGSHGFLFFSKMLHLASNPDLVISLAEALLTVAISVAGAYLGKFLYERFA